MAPILFPLTTGVNYAFLHSGRVACDSDKATSDGLAFLPACMKNHNLEDFAVKTAEEVLFGRAQGLS